MAINYPTSLDSFTNPSASSLLTSPSHAQQHADINDAMEAVQTKLAIGNTVIGTYTAYTPTLAGITIGNGTVDASYCRVNNFVHVVCEITFGSTTTLTGISSITLPVNLGTAFQNLPLGTVQMWDQSSSSSRVGVAFQSGGITNRAFLAVLDATTVYVATTFFLSATVPFTWATSDKIGINLYYKAA
jgi:hypothetical protein